VLPSTEQITTFIQDASAGTSTIIPATSFKTRQYKNATGTNPIAGQARYFGKQYTPDENASVQVTLGATTKPPIMLDPSTNTPTESGQVLRWLMSHQYLMDTNQCLKDITIGVQVHISVMTFSAIHPIRVDLLLYGLHTP
jgi:competence transcription factor ComK